MIKTLSSLLFLLFPFMLSAQDIVDDFNSLVLDPNWSWVREDRSHWTLTGEAMQITTQPGALNGIDYNNVKNLLLRPAPTGTMILETKVTFNPDSSYHNAGLVYYIDDDNYIRVSRGMDGWINGVWMEWEKDGATTFFYVDSVTASTVYLRLSRTNDTFFYASYSLNGTEWYYIGSETLTYSGTPRVGLQAANGAGIIATTTRIPASFDYFTSKLVTSIESPQQNNGFSIRSIYPNPASNTTDVTIQISGSRRELVSLRLLDLNGRVIRSHVIPLYENVDATSVIETTGLPSGRYIIDVRSESERIVRSLVIHK